MFRMSRARWLALGSTFALAGCTSPPDEAPPPPQPIADAVALDTSTTEPLDAPESKDATTTDVALGPGEAGKDSSHPAFDSSLDDATREDAALDAGADAERKDAAHDAGVDTDAGLCTGKPGTFPCVLSGYSGVCCNRATEYCQTVATFGAYCEEVDAHFPPQCQKSRTCECLDGSAVFLGSCRSCEEDDAGDILIACGACYGAPPARLERLLLAA
jgi:hypothetical protein